ncbi:MAG: Trm112 family protein [Candidatus Odinarchaeia archaeon]
MRLWLQNILACPICKHHPLNLIIFEYESEDKNIDYQEAEKIFLNDIQKGIISIDSLLSIEDKTFDEQKQSRLKNMKELIAKIDFNKKINEIYTTEEIKEILDVVYGFSIKVGVFKCAKCGRWFPIGSSVEGIPEMLPDDLRDKTKDQKFLDKWSEKIGSIISS